MGAAGVKLDAAEFRRPASKDLPIGRSSTAAAGTFAS